MIKLLAHLVYGVYMTKFKQMEYELKGIATLYSIEFCWKEMFLFTWKTISIFSTVGILSVNTFNFPFEIYFCLLEFHETRSKTLKAQRFE